MRCFVRGEVGWDGRGWGEWVLCVPSWNILAKSSEPQKKNHRIAGISLNSSLWIVPDSSSIGLWRYCRS